MDESGRRTTTVRPWHVSAALFILFGVAGFGFGVAGLGTGHTAEEPSFAELGWWVMVLGAGQLFLLLALLALLHRGPGIMYSEVGLPGISTWSAGGVCTLSIMLVAFAGLSLGAWIGTRDGQEGSLGSTDLAAITLWSIGGWVATVAFVPLRRRIRGLRHQE